MIAADIARVELLIGRQLAPNEIAYLDRAMASSAEFEAHVEELNRILVLDAETREQLAARIRSLAE